MAVHRAGNIAIADPEYFADDSLNWARIRSWMSKFTVPVIVADDGEVNAIDGIHTTPTVTALLREIARVLL
jgi:hypothetical protein